MFTPVVRRCYARWPVLCLAGSFLSAAVGTPGCVPDGRISLDEFLELQKNAAEIAPPAEGEEGSTPPAAAGQGAKELLQPYRVGPFDVLLVSLTGLNEPTLSVLVRVRIDRQGNIDLPLVGAVNINDLELPAAEAAIEAAYVPNMVRQLSVNAEVESYGETNVVVVGAATTPGLITLRRTQRNLLYAVAGAGGFTDAASCVVTLQRISQPEIISRFDLTDPLQLEAAVHADPLEPGDIVVVEAARPNTIFVGGLVNAPAPQVYAQGVEMNILQVIAAAGGLRTDVTPREGTLVRRMPDGSDVHVKLDLQRMYNGEDPNIALAAGDILWVPETIGTKIEDFINRNIFLRAGVTVTYSVTGLEFLNRRSLQTTRTGAGLGGGLEDAFDPFGFITRSSALQSIAPR